MIPCIQIVIHTNCETLNPNPLNPKQCTPRGRRIQAAFLLSDPENAQGDIQVLREFPGVQGLGL